MLRRILIFSCPSYLFGIEFSLIDTAIVLPTDGTIESIHKGGYSREVWLSSIRVSFATLHLYIVSGHFVKKSNDHIRPGVRSTTGPKFTVIIPTQQTVWMKRCCQVTSLYTSLALAKGNMAPHQAWDRAQETPIKKKLIHEHRFYSVKPEPVHIV